MQSQSSFFRGSILIASGAVTTIALGILVYSHFKSNGNHSQAEIKLHRRNAVRRRRRRWRRGFQPADLDYDPLIQALIHLKEREESGSGYGLYTNQHYVTTDLLNSRRDDFFLLLSNLDFIYTLITETSSLPPAAQNQLKLHIHSAFVGNFLREEYPQGYLVNGDVDELVQVFQPIISPYTVRKCVEAFDEAGYTIEMDYPCTGFPITTGPWQNNEDGATAGDSILTMSPTELHGRLAEAGGWTDEDGEQQQGRNVLDLLYRIGEEQAKRSGYQHRGVECNGCGMQPIRGIRYHCANCWDYDLCEACESQQTHHKTHIFYKIRIPAPTRGQIKLIQPIWYPGKPDEFSESIPSNLKDTLLKDTELNRQDLDALYDQFKCIAGHPLSNDGSGVGMAIDKPGFHRYYSTTTADRPSKPNLIHDRIFAFYDRDADGLISFYEFAKGMAELMHNTSRHARIERAFRAFDLDSDGYLERKDFIRMLRAHYALNKELSEEVMFAREDTVLGNDDMYEIIRGTNPISAAFRGSMFEGHRSRHGEGKYFDEIGDMVMNDVYEGILRDDTELVGNRAEAIARQASGGRSLLERTNPNRVRTQSDEPIFPVHHVFAMSDDSEPDVNENLEVNGEDVDHLDQLDSWPKDDTEESDVIEALGTNVALEDVLDPLDRRRILFAQKQRQFRAREDEFYQRERIAVWKRWEGRRFYMDEQEGIEDPDGSSSSKSDQSKPSENVENPSILDDTTKTQRPRSLSKVRFDESAVDVENEGQTETSSRPSSKPNTPVNERWGGIDFSQAERDTGREFVYEAVQEAFLEMLNHFFLGAEERALGAISSRKERSKHADELQKYENSLKLDGATAAELVAHEKKIHSEARRVGNDYILKRKQEQNGPDYVLDLIDLVESDEEGSDHIFQVYDQSYTTNPNKFPVWHQHNIIDQRAKERNGYGKLSLEEFKQKLRTNVDGEKGKKEDEEVKYWETNADLEKFSFLSTWLEMASF